MHETPRVSRRAFLRATGASVLAGATVRTVGATPDSGARSEVVIGIDPSAADWHAAVERAVPRGARVRSENPVLGYVVAELPEQAASAASVGESTGSTGGSTRRRARASGVPTADEVAYVEENVRYHSLSTQGEPDDPRYPDQYVPEIVGAEEAWRETTGSGDVTVAVIDSGVAYDHPDLAANLRDDPGRDFVDGDDDPAPATATTHGTEVAGVIGGVANNATGIAGLSQSELIVGRVLEDRTGTLADIAAGIQWAVEEGASVINLSLGSRTDAATMRRALAYAEDHGALAIAAAGNSGGDVVYPAANEACLGVSALNTNGGLADFSSVGPEIGIAAPGVDVLSTQPGESYGRFTGTSAATPVVSGVAALALARWDLTGPELRYHLRATASDVGLADIEQGAGRVDAARAVSALPKTIALVGSDERATYEFSVDGRLERGSYANTEDTISQATATGAVQNGLDTYRFSGSVTDFSHEGPVSVRINGQPTEYGTDATSSGSPDAIAGFATPTDPDGDGRYEDVTGDGTTNVVDVQALFANRNSEAVTQQSAAFDFTGNGSVNVVDVQKLFAELT